MTAIKIERGKTVELPISLGFNVSDYEFASEIRVGVDISSSLIASWDVSFETDGKNGKLIATIDGSVTANITQDLGYMMLNRVKNATSLPVFETPIEVEIVNS